METLLLQISTSSSNSFVGIITLSAILQPRTLWVLFALQKFVHENSFPHEIKKECYETLQ